MMVRWFLFLSAVLGFLGVAIGAFGAHGLQATLTANGTLDTFQTASRYHMYHALALFGVAWVASRRSGRLVAATGYLLFAGTLLFSGSLYLLAVFNLKFMGAVAPLGGLLLLAGWAGLGVIALRLERED